MNAPDWMDPDMEQIYESMTPDERQQFDEYMMNAEAQWVSGFVCGYVTPPPGVAAMLQETGDDVLMGAMLILRGQVGIVAPDGTDYAGYALRVLADEVKRRARDN